MPWLWAALAHNVQQQAMIKLQLWIFRSSPSPIKFPPLASAPTVCYQTGPPINLTYDGSSFLQVVLCYQLHIPVPPEERCSPSCCYTLTQTNSEAHTRKHTDGGHRGTDTCRLFVTSSVDICDSVSLWEEKAIWCRQGWIRRGPASTMHHAALFCGSEVCKVVCR